MTSLNNLDAGQSYDFNEDLQAVYFSVYYLESLLPAEREEVVETAERVIQLWHRDQSLVQVVYRYLVLRKRDY